MLSFLHVMFFPKMTPRATGWPALGGPGETGVMRLK
jgi:hypothetical protein